MVQYWSFLPTVAGANDVLRGMRNAGKVDEFHVAENIIDIANEGRRLGVENIYISGIITSGKKHLQQVIKNINSIVHVKCLESNFTFVDQSNIYSNDISHDKVHLKWTGTRKLRDNLLRCCETYNPYLCGDEF